MAKASIGSWVAQRSRVLAHTLTYCVSVVAAQGWLPLILVTLALLIMTGGAQAHGGSGYYLVRGVAVGDYMVHAWVSPGVMRTGDVHVDTALFDANGAPALLPLIRVTLTPLDGKSPPVSALAGPPAAISPFEREARFWLDRPGLYQLEIMVDDGAASPKAMAMEVNVQAVGWPVKLAMIAAIVASASCGLWLLLETRTFWRTPGDGQHSA